MGMRASGDYATAFRYSAAHMLELNSGVVDCEAITQHSLQALQNVFAGRRRNIFDQRVAAQSMGARTETPDMQVMHVEHAWDLPHSADHRLQLQTARQALQQNIERLVDNVPRRPNDQHADSDGQGWVDLLPATVVNSDC